MQRHVWITIGKYSGRIRESGIRFCIPQLSICYSIGNISILILTYNVTIISSEGLILKEAHTPRLFIIIILVRCARS